MGAGNLCYGIRLTNHEHCFNLAQIIFSLAFCRAPVSMISIKKTLSSQHLPNDEEVCRVWLLSEQRCTDEVIIEGLDSLSWHD